MMWPDFVFISDLDSVSRLTTLTIYVIGKLLYSRTRQKGRGLEGSQWNNKIVITP